VPSTELYRYCRHPCLFDTHERRYYFIYTSYIRPESLTAYIHTDPSAPNFRKWLRSVGAGAYISSFFKAGYDLGFIAKQGLTSTDLDCIGIPKEQLGVRRKLESLHKIGDYHKEEEDSDEDKDDDDDDDDDSDDDESEPDDDSD
jgi:hypothetical protein